MYALNSWGLMTAAGGSDPVEASYRPADATAEACFDLNFGLVHSLDASSHTGNGLIEERGAAGTHALCSRLLPARLHAGGPQIY
jgi:hypothetical protein